MNQIAYKFVSWDVPALESLAGSKAYILRKRLNDGGTLTREEKDWITREVNHNTYFKDSIPLLGYRFNFVDVLKTFVVKQYGHYTEYKGVDKTSIRSMLYGRVERIVELKNRGGESRPTKKNITMKIIYKSYMARPLKPFGEWDWEVREAVKTALALVEGKNGFKTHSEIWRRCNLVITVGHNIYTTSIEIRPPEQDVIRRRSNWHNGYAYYCNGVFWANMSRVRVELV